jgi:Tfp pilus assembly protein PilV
MKKRKNQGQSLIEVLTALAIAILIIVALVAGVTYAIRNLTHARNQALATQYAQEGLERARQERDTKASAFFDNDYCDGWDDHPGIFTRDWDCTYNSSPKYMDVVVTVSWNEGGKSHSTVLTTRLTDWR